ncbi:MULTISPECIES: carboxyl-terminal processing protease CtpA [Cyanophyceae]|uniref:carboxyl-terminal processing protease CtpA n=1 Tax=Cyanophyceae TaxID=3028117 RepID=UPI001689D345|nr:MULTISPECIES: carboxyl-terminal processing protease CtpA [Cyanophyceae]MBD1918435.1 PDZ domain-containing protein [Phormidium sp. FACHB-77]MBD2028696.1 PDZ domain-containing protein [Phormidium sp. FACHB-322]MBD2051117.1 PDZ domain-containing protein [Leptolyngbya sp. FACHB-60]
MIKPLLRLSILSLCLMGLVVGGVSAGPAFALTEEQNLVAEVWRIVNRAYVDETFNHQNWWFTRQRALDRALASRDDTYQAIQDMLAGLEDPYTRLLPPEQYRSLQTSTAGALTGVGLQISKDEQPGWLRVIAPIEGSPAEQAGIQPQDVVLEIDGVATTELTLDEAAARMRGQRGTTVTLQLRSLDETTARQVSLTRDVITLNPVVAALKTTPGGQRVGYLRLSQFNGNASEKVSAAIQTLANQGAEGYLLDLRNNPGGLLQAGIEIARLWLPQGTIVYTVNRQGILDSFEAFGQAITDAPLVVLVNEGTASASEILAGALQDNGRATLVGSTTFGKGLIQSLFDLSDGAGLAVTVAKYETPAHHDINRLGIKPDRIVASVPLSRDTVATDADPQYQAALEMLSQATVLASAS